MDKINVLTTVILAVLTAAVFTQAYAEYEETGTSITRLNENIGPAYDPLFYDVMVYVFGVMIFAIFLLSVIAYWIRRKGIGTSSETWLKELEKYYEKEGIGLLPEESRK